MVLIYNIRLLTFNQYTVEPLLRGHPDERQYSLKRQHDIVNLNHIELITTPDERPPILRGHISDSNEVAPKGGSHYIT